MRYAVDIEWENKNLPEKVEIPRYIDNDEVSDYLQEKYNSRVISYYLDLFSDRR